MNGQCKNGDRCKFEHPPGAQIAQNNKNNAGDNKKEGTQRLQERVERERPPREERNEVEIKDP
jgi:hypothetical protein